MPGRLSVVTGYPSQCVCEARSVLQFPGADEGSDAKDVQWFASVIPSASFGPCGWSMCVRGRATQVAPVLTSGCVWGVATNGPVQPEEAASDSASLCFQGSRHAAAWGAWPTAPGDSSQPRAPALSQPAPHTCCRGGPGAASGCLHTTPPGGRLPTRLLFPACTYTLLQLIKC